MDSTNNTYEITFYVYESDDSQNQHKKITNSLTKAVDYFKKAYSTKDNHYLAIGVDYKKTGDTENSQNGANKSLDLLAAIKGIETPVLMMDEKNLGELFPNSLIRINTRHILDRVKENILRASRHHTTLTEMFKKSDCDCYDTCDTTFDVIVTCSECDDNESGEDFEYYDKFCKYINDNTIVLREPDDVHTNVVCDYSELILRNYNKLNDVVDETWRRKPADVDDFVYEWCNEIHMLLAGYGDESTYKYLCDTLESENTLSEPYKEFLETEIIPYMSHKDKLELLSENYDTLSFKDKCISYIVSYDTDLNKVNSTSVDEALDLTESEGISR